MSTSSSSPNLALRFLWDASHFYSTRSISVRGEVVEQHSDTHWYSVLDAPLGDLVVEARLSQWDSAGTERHITWKAEYRSPYAVSLERARGMVAVLSKLERGLEQLERQQGRVANFGQYMARVASILGIPKIVLPETFSPDLGARVLSPGAAADALNYHIDIWWRTGEGPAGTASGRVA